MEPKYCRTKRLLYVFGPAVLMIAMAEPPNRTTKEDDAMIPAPSYRILAGSMLLAPALLLPAVLTAQEATVRESPAAVNVTTLVATLDGGVAVDRAGFVYVADFRETVWKVTPDGRVRVLATGLYARSGNAERAIELYEKSLELNPANQNGKAMLEKLPDASPTRGRACPDIRQSRTSPG